MKTIARRRVVLEMVAALAVSGLATAAFAQADPHTGLIGKGRKAYSIPVSDRMVQFKVTIPSAHYTSTITVREGGMAKVYALKAGFAYALVPLVQGINNDAARFTIFRLTQDKEGNESLQELERVSTTLDREASTQAEPKLQIQLTHVDSPDPGAAVSSGRRGGRGQQNYPGVQQQKN